MEGLNKFQNSHRQYTWQSWDVNLESFGFDYTDHLMEKRDLNHCNRKECVRHRVG